jgi:hypothetical protein
MIQGFSGGLLNRELIYQTDLPSFQRDFASLKTLDHGTGPAITFTRASDATYFDADGVLQTAANDTPRFDHDPATGGSSLGLLIEEARTNSIRNSQAGGAVVGAPGTMPTFWTKGADSNSVTSEVIGSGTEDGLSYVDVKIAGTPTATAATSVQFESSTQVVATSGQTWTASSYVKMVSGSSANSTVLIRLSGRTAAGAAVSVETTSSATFNPTTAALRTQRFTVTRPLTEATTERILTFLVVSYTSGNPIDLTLRIAAPQLEQGAFPTSYIPTTTAAVTRSADSAVVTPISSFYNASEGTLFAEGLPNAANTGTSAHLLSIGSSGAEYLSLIRITSGGTARAWAAVAGTLVADLGTTAFSATGKLAFAAKQDDFAFSFNGGTVATDTSGTMPSADRLRIGTRADAGANINGHIRKIAYWPKRLTNTLLQQLTT